MIAGAVDECRRACRPARRQLSLTRQRRAVLVNMHAHILEVVVDVQAIVVGVVVVEERSTRTAATNVRTGRTLCAPRRRVSRMLLALLLASTCPLSSALLTLNRTLSEHPCYCSRF